MFRVLVLYLMVFGATLFASCFAHGHFGQYGGYPGRHHHHDGCHYQHGNAMSINCTISRINRTFSMAASSIRKFCEQNAGVTPTIQYGEEAYIIKYQLPTMNNLTISVKAANSLLITEVKEQGDFKGFQDIRVLPEILNLQNGSWFIEQSNLKIMLPYKIILNTEFTAVCETDGGEVNIPGLLPSFKLRSSN